LRQADATEGLAVGAKSSMEILNGDRQMGHATWNSGADAVRGGWFVPAGTPICVGSGRDAVATGASLVKRSPVSGSTATYETASACGVSILKSPSLSAAAGVDAGASGGGTSASASALVAGTRINAAQFGHGMFPPPWVVSH
jgi:hypothetical protein